MARRSSLGKNAKVKQTAGDVLLGCIEILRKNYPTAVFFYDAEFFGVIAV